jgi:uncharacterized membrane protein
MAWTVGASGLILGLGSLSVSYDASSGTINEKSRSSRMGIGATLSGLGSYLFISGLMINALWPFSSFQGGAYDVLFGGISCLGGLLLIVASISLFLNSSLKIISYFAAIVGLYAAIDAVAINSNGLTSSPLLAALGYLSFSAVAFLSVPATHVKNKWARLIFVLFAFIFAVAWIYQAADFTWAHL